jgi:hypothetical protein
MSEKLFEVVITGNTIPGMDKAEVIVNFANLFKVDSATAEKMLSGKTRIIKKNVDHKTGFKYHQALRKAGVLAMLKPVEDPVENAPKQSNELGHQHSPIKEPEPKQIPTHTNTNTNANINTNDESSPTNIPKQQLGNTQLTQNSEPKSDAYSQSESLTVAAVGETIPVLKDEQVALNPDTSGLSVAQVGSKLDELKPEQDIVKPDISHLDVAAAGEVLAEKAEVITLELDLSAFSVAESGADLEELKQDKELLNPDTSNLSLE